MKLLGREIARRTSLILGILVIFALAAVAFGIYALVSDDSDRSDEAQNQLQRTGVLANPEQTAFPVPKPSGPALSSEDLPETVSLPESPVIDVAVGTVHSCALHQDTTVSCWGSNRRGQIGANLDSGLPDDIGITQGRMVSTPTKVKLQISDNELVDLRNVKSISSGEEHTCALHNDTTVSCWGRNDDAQLGHESRCPIRHRTSEFRPVFYAHNGSCADKVLTKDGTELKNVIQIETGGSSTCVLLSNGIINCWGRLSLDTYSTYPTEIPNLKNIPAITGGRFNLCVLQTDTTVSCSGSASSGRLGNGQTDTYNSFGYANFIYQEEFTKVKRLDESGNLVDLDNVKFISSTSSTTRTCALHFDNSLSCWGIHSYDFTEGSRYTADGHSVPGPTDEDSDRTATKVQLSVENLGTLESFNSVSVGTSHICATSGSENKLYCWDINTSGQLGNGIFGPVADKIYPVIHSDGYVLTEVSKVAAGDSHTCAIHGKNNVLSCWGRGDLGQLGFSSSALLPDLISTPIDGVETFKSISAGVDYTCVIHDDNVSCLGRGDSGQLGNGELGHSSTPVAVINSDNTPLDNVSAISTGDKYSCAIHGTTGEVSCWGTNDSNTLATASDSSNSRAVEIGIQDATSISVGYNHACAVYSRGKVSCWGDNTFGQLGNGNLMTDFIQVTAGYAHSCGIHRDGTASCWGLDDGRLGHINKSSFEATSTPLRVGGLTNVVSIAAGHSHTCAVWRSNKKVSCWGSNNFSQLGNPNISDFSSAFVDVVNEAGSPLVSAIGVSAGENTACAVFEDLEISCWGNGAYGKLLARNSRSDAGHAVNLSESGDYFKPDPIYGGIGLRSEEGDQISVGKNHSCEITNNHRGSFANCWGSNYYGELGNLAKFGYSAVAVYVNF